MVACSDLTACFAWVACFDLIACSVLELAVGFVEFAFAEVDYFASAAVEACLAYLTDCLALVSCLEGMHLVRWVAFVDCPGFQVQIAMAGYSAHLPKAVVGSELHSEIEVASGCSACTVDSAAPSTVRLAYFALGVLGACSMAVDCRLVFRCHQSTMRSR